MSHGFTPRQEEDQLPARAVLAVLAGGIGFAGICVITGWLMSSCGDRTFRPSGHWPEMALGAPHEIAGVEESLVGQASDTIGEGQALEAAVAQRLVRYQWVDRAKGLIVIPIDRAIDRVGSGLRPTPSSLPVAPIANPLAPASQAGSAPAGGSLVPVTGGGSP